MPTPEPIPPQLLAARLCGALLALVAAVAHAQTFRVEAGALRVLEAPDLAQRQAQAVHQWSRTYRPGNASPGDFGPGWHATFHGRLHVQTSGNVVVDSPRLGRVVYLPEPAPAGATVNAWRDTACPGAGVVRRDAGFEHRPCGGAPELYAASGQLTGWRMRLPGGPGPQRLVRIERDARGQATGLHDDAGGRVEFERDSQGRITLARGQSDGQAVALRYRYDPGGQLAAVLRQDSKGETVASQHYAHDEQGRLDVVGLGHLARRIGYDAAGRVEVMHDGVSRWQYRYRVDEDQALHQELEFSGPGQRVEQTQITDREGRRWVDHDAAGARMRFDPATGRLLEVTGSGGVRREYGYDPDGRGWRVRASDGDQQHWRLGADDLPMVVTVRVAQGSALAPLVAPDASAELRLAWHTQGQPKVIEWTRHCRILLPAEDADPAAMQTSGSAACLKRLKQLYSTLF